MAEKMKSEENTLSYELKYSYFPYQKSTNFWNATSEPTKKQYVVETSIFIIQRLLLMTIDPDDIVFDPTCGSGTTSYVSEQWDQQWITCITRRVALTLTKQRFMTVNFYYYQLAHPHEGAENGFIYKTVPHITPKSVTNNEPSKEETLYGRPYGGMQLLKVQMNADLFTDDFKKKLYNNDSFWLIGHPDVEIKTITTGKDKGRYKVEVPGFDYYNPKTGNVESGNKGNIAMWLPDTDYNDCSLFPSHAFFPMAGSKNAGNKLSRNLKAEINKKTIKAFKGTISFSFKKDDNTKITMKIIDDRAQHKSLRAISL